MSSASDSIAAGTVLQNYRLVERLGGAAHTWLAEDTRHGTNVVIKILSRILPKDKPSRDALLKQVQLKAAVGHPGLANIILIDIDQDVLWMASEQVEGETLSQRAQRVKAGKKEFFRYAWQMADALSAVHAKSIVLGQITGDSWIITPDDDVKLVGFRFSSFMGKQETGQTLISGIKATHLREAAYLSPEQVTGKLVTSRTDIFALGVCLYEMIAGALPFQGASVADVAHAVNTASPAAPINPAIDRPLLGLVGKCIHKNPDSRYEKISLLKDDLASAEPDIDTISRRRGVTSPGGIPLPKKAASAAADTFIVVGELPYHELLRSKDPERASKLENTMQQYLGEAVYLFDGTVLDSLGGDMIASMPDGASAIKAAQKGLADLVEHNMTHGDDPVEARMLVHYGELVASTGRPEGAGLTTAMSVLEAMEPLQLLVSKPVIDRVDVDGEPVSIGRLADIDFFQAPKLKEPKPVAPVAPADTPTATPVQTAASTAPSAPSAEPPSQQAAAPAAKTAPKKGLPVVPIAIAVVLVIVLGAAGAYFMTKGRGEEAAPAPVAQTPRPAAPAPVVVEIDPNKVYFAPFEIDQSIEPLAEVPEAGDIPTEVPATEEVPLEATSTDTIDAAEPVAPEISIPTVDPELQLAAVGLHAVVERIIALDSDLQILDAAAEDSRTMGGRISRSEEGIVLTPFVLEGENVVEGQALLLTETNGGALAYVRTTWTSLGRDLSFLPASEEVVLDYLDALSFRDQAELDKAFAKIEDVNEAEPGFVAALKLRMSLLLMLDKPEDAIETAKRIAVLDPTDAEIRHQLADWEFERGNPGYGLVWLGELLAVEPENPDLLTRIGQYSLAVGNEEKFNTVLARLGTLEVENPRLNAGDIILSRGRLDAAAKKYYEDLPDQPDNAVLALKIGRLAVLRRSDAVIQAEIERLERVQAPYELAMMRAYMNANLGDPDSAALELQQAELSADKLDSLFTASAEVYLLLNRQDQVLEALEKAVGRAEPTHEYILSNPIFGYLSNDPRFRSVLQRIEEQRTRISAALETIVL